MILHETIFFNVEAIDRFFMSYKYVPKEKVNKQSYFCYTKLQKLQRLIHDKQHNNYTWSPVMNSSDLESKAKQLKKQNRTNELKKLYLFFLLSLQKSFFCKLLELP